MSKVTRIIYLADQILGSRKTTGWINRIIKIIADRNINRVAVLSCAVIVGGNVNQDLVNINAADFLVAMTGMLWQDRKNSGFFQFLYVAGQGTVGNSQTGSQLVHIHFLMLKKNLDQPYTEFGTKGLKNRDCLFQTFNIQHNGFPFLNLEYIFNGFGSGNVQPFSAFTINYNESEKNVQ